MRTVPRGLLALLCCVASAVSADENVQKDGGFSWDIGLGQVSFDSSVADKELIKDSATYIRFAGEIQRASLLTGFGLSGYFYDDSADFSQVVQDQFGNISNASSTATAFNLFAEVGYRYPISDTTNFDFFGGFEQVISSDRSIANCSNCDSESIDVKSGAYVKPRIQAVTDGGWTFSLSYQQNVSGDVNNVVAFSIGKHN